MTLAVILLINLLCVASGVPAKVAQTTGQGSAASTAQKPDQGTTSSQTQSPAPSTSTPTKKTTAPAKLVAPKRPRRKKKAVASNCTSPPAAASSAPPGTQSGNGSPDAPAVPPSATTNSNPTNCPPSKVIVRQGGTSEPSIQLAGDASSPQAVHQRETANQLLGSTEQNLKKIAGHQLSASQQDMVTQIRQFMELSKDAENAGDPERARTLAWKAELLSEELVKPAQ